MPLSSAPLRTRMNYFSAFIFVLCFNLASAYILSAPKPDIPGGKKCKALYKSLGKVIGTPKESPEKITRVLKKADLSKCFLKKGIYSYSWYLNLAALVKGSDVFQLMLTRGAAVLSPHAVSCFYREALRYKLLSKSYRIKPNSEDETMVLYCLQNWALHTDRRTTLYQEEMDKIIEGLLRAGNVPLVKSFLAHGCMLPRCISSLDEIFSNEVETAIFLFEHPDPSDRKSVLSNSSIHGYTALNSQRLLETLLRSSDFTVGHLEGLFKKGLLKENIVLDLALVNGRMDLAYAAYKQGLRLDSYYWLRPVTHLNIRFQELPLSKFAEHIANEKIKMLLAATSDPTSHLYQLPKEVVATLIHSYLQAVTAQNYLKEIIQPVEDMPYMLRQHAHLHGPN